MAIMTAYSSLDGVPAVANARKSLSNTYVEPRLWDYRRLAEGYCKKTFGFVYSNQSNSV